MSQINPNTPSGVTEGYPVTNLTLVVLLLIPCVVILLLLNCLFLGYKLMILSKRQQQRRDDSGEMLLQSVHRHRTGSDLAFPPLQDGRRVYVSVSEPVLPHPVTSSRASSRDRAGLDHRTRLLRPDGATGSGSLRAPSSIRGTPPAAGFSPRLDLRTGSRTHSARKGGWCRSAPLLPQSSDSEAETRLNLAPPNSPTEAEHVGYIYQSRTRGMLKDVNPAAAAAAAVVHVFDKFEMECEYTNLPSETSCLNTSAVNTSAVGPGLDSDFGASAGVSLRILSADSDTLSNGVLASVLEWDYYDPCYVKQNNVPRHKHHRPAVHTKQYWV